MATDDGYGHRSHSGECDSCNWKTDDLTKVDAYARLQGAGPFTPDDEKPWGWLCEVCQSTYAGNAWLYPRQYDNEPLFATVAWGINRILAEIRTTS